MKSRSNKPQVCKNSYAKKCTRSNLNAVRLERQADRAAERFTKGETNIAVSLSATTAASKPSANSQSHSLPYSLKHELESSFYIDLNQIKIHIDNESHNATRELNAQAFAAGSHIYFSKNSFRPNEKSGKNLIAHEVAHSIQQASRASHVGQFGRAVTNTSSTGMPQCKELPLTSTENVPEVEALLQKHQDAVPQVLATDPAQIINLFILNHRAAERAGNVTSYWNNIAANVLALRNITLPTVRINEVIDNPYVSAAIFDALKRTEHYEAAGKILELNQSVKSFFYSAEFYQDFLSRIASSETPFRHIANYWNNADFFEHARPIRMFDTVRSYLMGPTRDIPNLGGTPMFQEAALQFLSRKDNLTDLIENETFFATVWTVKQVDQMRINKLSELARSSASNTFRSFLNLQQRKLVAHGFERWALQYDTTPSSTTDTEESPVETIAAQETNATEENQLTLEEQFVLEALGHTWVLIAQDAKELIDSAIHIERVRRRGGVIEELGDAGDLVLEIGTRMEFEELHETMLQKLNALLERRNGQIITSLQYNYHLNQAIRHIRGKLYYQVEAPAVSHARRVRAGATVSQEESRLFYQRLWMLLVFAEFIQILKEYKYQDDVLFETTVRERNAEGEFSGPGRNDVRIAHRIKVARWLANFGAAIGWENIAQLGAPIFTATEAGQTHSEIALIGDWREDTGVAIGRIREDFSSSTYIGAWAPLRPADLASFFQARYFEQLTNHLDQLVNDQFLERDTPLIREAKRLAHEHPGRPRKFVIQDNNFFIALHDADSDRLDLLYESHPKTQLKLRELGWPVRVNSKRDVFFWTFPAMGDVVALLQSRQVFHDLIERHRIHTESLPSQDIVFEEGTVVQSRVGVVGDNPDMVEPPEWSGWLERLSRAIDWWNGLSDDEKEEEFNGHLTTAIDEFQTGISENLDETYNDAMTAQRRASIYERHAFINRWIRPNLNAYDRYDHFSEAPFGGLIYGIPNQVARDISIISSRAQPQEEQAGHFAVTFLEIADLLVSRFANNERFDIYLGYKYLVDQAIEFVDQHPFTIWFYLTEQQKNTHGWVRSRKAQLQTVKERFEAFTLNLQMQFGFGGSTVNNNKILYGLDQGFTISTSEPAEGESPIGGPRFTIDGINYRLINVFHDFVYHPPVGDSQGVLFVDGEQVRPYQEGQGAPSEPRVLFQIEINGNAQDITEATNDELLKTLSHAIQLEAVNRNLQNLGEIIETFNEVLMEGVELVPGAGQLVMIARIGMSVIQMINSGEFDDIKDLLFTNPEEVFENVEERIQQALRPATLWNFLLFADDSLMGLFPPGVSEERQRRRRPTRRRGTSAKLRRLAATLTNVGRSIALSIANLQLKLQGPVRRLQLFVVSRPILGFLFRQIEQNIAFIETLDVQTIRDLADDAQDFDNALNSMPEKIHEIVHSVNNIELPDEIFSMEDILEVVLELVVDRLPAKAEFPARMVLLLLEVGDIKGELLRAIGDWIGEIADPNDLWVDLKNQHINPLFQDARWQLLTQSILTINRVQGLGFNVPPLSDFSPKNGDLIAPEVEGFNDKQSSQLNQFYRGRSIGHIPIHSGSPLNRSMQYNAQRSFGHDFGHVRLHTGSAGDRITQPFKAEAMTSGSHIFVSSGINPESNRGKHVLNHELTHVLQQSGSRPLGDRHSQIPTLGKSSVGFNFDTRREIAAERVASITNAGKLASKPVDPGAGIVTGLQPTLDDAFMMDFFRFITSFESLQEFSESTLDRARAVALDPGIRRQVHNVPRKLRDIANHVEQLHIGSSSPLHSVKQNVSNWLTRRFRGGEFTRAIEAIAKNAQREERSSGNSQQEPDKYLHLGSFARGLKTWIFANSGIEVNIQLNRRGALGSRRELARGDPINAMRVDDIFLPAIPNQGEGRDLWATVIDNSFGNDVNNDRAKRRHRAYARAYLGTLGPTVKSLRSGFRFKTRIKNDISALVAASRSGGQVLEVNKLPPKSYYLHTDSDTTPNPIDASMGQTRLRLGLHKDGYQQGADRESHHVPQYLLIEYFSNTKTQKPFKHLDVLQTIGLNRQGDTIVGFSGDNTDELAVNSLKGSRRGNDMPSILLARVTHQQANLHVIGEADEESGGSATQGATIHNFFRNKIQELAGPMIRNKMFGDNASEFESIISRVSTPTDVQDNIYNAMRHTYKWMRSHMLERLHDGLVNDERRYYTSLARVATDSSISDTNGNLTPQYQISEGEMRHVYTVAEDHFDNVMNQAPNYWTLPS